MKKIEFVAFMLIYVFLLLMLIAFGRDSMVLICIAQFFVGIYQLLMSLIRTVNRKKYNESTQMLFTVYWRVCGIYFLGLGLIIMILTVENNLISNIGVEELMKVIAYYIEAAWLIAFYYTYVTYLLAFPKYIKSHLDI